MARQKRRRFKKTSIRLLSLVFLCELFLISAKNKTTEKSSVIVQASGEQVKVYESVSIKITLDLKQNKAFNSSDIKLQSDADFEIISRRLKIYNQKLEVLFTIKIKSLGENYFYLFINNKKIEIPEIKITTKLNELNAQTKFTWKFFNKDKTEVKENIIQGGNYFLILYGDFFNDKSKIEKLEYNTPENVLIEKIDDVDIKQKNVNQVIAFNILLLQYDKVSLPKIKIFYTDENKKPATISVPEKSIKVFDMGTKQSNAISDKEKNDTLEILESATEKQKSNISKAETITDKKYSQSEIALAKKVYEIRKSIFKNALQIKKLRELGHSEKTLHLKNSFNPLRKIFFLCLTIIALTVFSFLLFKYKFKSIVVNAFCVFVLILSFIFIKKFFTRYGLLFSESKIMGFSIPEENAKTIRELQIGECVIIERKVDKWYYVKTSRQENFWLKENDVLTFK